MIFSKRNRDILIEQHASGLVEGLFGQVFLCVFEILPYLHNQGIFPDWRISAAHYGGADGLVLPGAFDLAYEVKSCPKKVIGLGHLRNRHRHLLGSDWYGVSALWHAYFRVPDRIIEEAASLGSLSDAIGVHYRGNDKQTAIWDTNPVSYDDYLSIIRQFCKERPEFRRIFLATDDLNFCSFLKANIALEIINLGEVGFHKEPADSGADVKIHRAMLDCVLLSRCAVVLLTSSALPSFAKIIEPNLEIYRVAASKIYATTPYFPVAYIPAYKSSSSEIATIVDRLMVGDWTNSTYAELFSIPFVSRRLYSPTLGFLYNHVRRLAPANARIGRLLYLLAAFSRKGRLRLQRRRT